MNRYEEVMEHLYECNDRLEDMIEYKVVMKDLAHRLEKYYPDVYNDFVEKLEKVVYEISLEKATEIVHNMKPFGEHWTYDNVKNYVESKGIYRHYVNYYLVMNAMFNDYYDVATNFGHQTDTEFYYELTNAFINDVDGKKLKVEKYFSD